MKNRVQKQVMPETLALNSITDEYMFRELARKMVSDMPYEDLQKIMSFTKTDPYSEHSQKALRDPSAPDWLKNQIRILARMSSVPDL